MKYSNNNKIEVLNTEHAKGYRLAETSCNEVVNLQVKAGGVIPIHQLPVHVTFYLIKGEGILTIDNKEFIANEGDVLEVQAGANRTWQNNSNKVLELLVIKTKTA